jgi:dethiobiotin synthetase
VGKTLLTASLLLHVRQTGIRSLAMKPFCTGGRADVTVIRSIQGRDLPVSELNPFYFPDPLAPMVAARRRRCTVELKEVLDRVRRLRARCQCLILEGAGGLMSPLGEGFTLAEVVARLSCEVVVVARNRLGTLNHVLLTIAALKRSGARTIKVVLMDQARADASAQSNAAVLREWLSPIEVFSVPFLGKNAMRLGELKKNAIKIKKTLARVLELDTFATRCSKRSVAAGNGPTGKRKKIVDSRGARQQDCRRI